MNRNILIIIAIVLLAGGVFFSYENFHKPLPTKEIKDSPFSILEQNATETLAESTDWYETKIDYPKNNTKVRDMIFEQYKNFVDETGIKKFNNLSEAKEGLQLNVEGMKYNFYTTYKLATSSDSISYVYEIYTYTGGAHGSTINYPITLDTSLNVIPIEKVLPQSSLQKVSALCRTDIVKQKRERMESYGNLTKKEIDDFIKNDDFIDEGVKPIRDNFNNAWYEGDNIVVSFGQYQVGPYAEGMYEVRIPKSEVK